MRLGLFTLMLSLPSFFLAQDNKENSVYPNTFSSGSSKVTKFDNKARRYNDWAITIGGGTAFMQKGDLTSLNKDGKNFGWNAYAGLAKQISDKFGLELNYQTGKTEQTGRILEKPQLGLAVATTRYNQINLLGDLNFSNLFRRSDNKSPFRWSLHGYAGIGIQGYEFTRNDARQFNTVGYTGYDNFTQPLRMDSFIFSGGTGLRFNLSRRIDIDSRILYVISGDDEFDGGGQTTESPFSEKDTYNEISRNFSDNLIIANVGIVIKLGKHNTHLSWYDAGNETLRKIAALERKQVDVKICDKGDADKDAVCDDWDRELGTPIGARVDGSGKALDLDLDGVIDLEDKCVTVAGLAQNNGCPYLAENTLEIIETINKDFEGIEFELNKAVIRSQSFEKLNHASEIIKTLDNNSKFLVIGATDTRGSNEANLILSQKRANAVLKYLVDRGVNASMLTAEGRGETDLKYPECNPATKCPEWKNEANRRVYFKAK